MSNSNRTFSKFISRNPAIPALGRILFIVFSLAASFCGPAFGWEVERFGGTGVLGQPAGTLGLKAFCQDASAVQLSYAKQRFLPQIRRDYAPFLGNRTDAEINFFCRNEDLYWNANNGPEGLLDHQSAYCRCFHETVETSSPRFDGASCLSDRLKQLGKEIHYASVTGSEGALQCLNGDLVRSRGVLPPFTPSYRILERTSPFCRCPQQACTAAPTDTCSPPDLCLGGMCRAPQPVCDRQCIERQRNRLEADVKKALIQSDPRRTLYLSPQGDDTGGDGTSAKPYQTLAKAFTKLGGHTTLILAPGRYAMDPIVLKGDDLEIKGSGYDKTIIRVNYYPNYDTMRLIWTDGARVILKDFTMETLYRPPGAYSESIFKIAHALNFYNSRVLIDHVNFTNFSSNQFFGLFNSVFAIRNVEIGGEYSFPGDLGWEIMHSQGIIENCKVLDEDGENGRRVNLDHIIDVHGIPSQPTVYYDARLIKEKNPDRLLIRNNYLMGRHDTCYGDGMRIQSGDQDGQEYYLLDNTVTKSASATKPDPTDICWGVRVKVNPKSILEMRNNDISRHSIGFSLQGEPYDWTGAMLFERNRLHDNSDIGLEIGLQTTYMADLGSRPFAFIDFGGGMMASEGKNAFYDNGNEDVLYRYGSTLYIRNNYWGTLKADQIRLKKVHPNAVTVVRPLIDSQGNIVP